MSTKFSTETETHRIEFFSDAVFAIVVTLLALDLKFPIGVNSSIVGALAEGWPSFFAFFASFITVLTMWMNHHYLFGYISKSNSSLMLLNGLLLLFVTLTPFTTSLVAETILTPQAATVAVLYSGSFLLLSLCWNMLWSYVSKKRRLIIDGISDRLIRSISFRCRLGIVLYSLAIFVSFLSALGGIGFVIAISVFWAAMATVKTDEFRQNRSESLRKTSLPEVS